MAETKKQRLETQWGDLANERASFLSHWKELADYYLPRRPRFNITDVNRGDRRSTKIVDSTGTFALRTLVSGMQAGITSPARPWFRLTTPDPGLAEVGPVKLWLDTVTNRMRTVKLRSNFYQCMPMLYTDLGCFGTGALFKEEDFDRVERYFSIPIGSYVLANDDTGRVNTFIREFRMTVRQMVKRFGKQTKSGAPDWTIFSERVKAAWENGNYNEWIDIRHAVMPNDEYDRNKAMPKFKRFASCYYEAASDTTDERYLGESGYDRFPVLAARWNRTGEDTYATDSPGMMALGDVKALQAMQRRKAQAIDKMVNPPLIAPPAMASRRISMLPGDLTYNVGGADSLKPLHDVRLDLNHLLADIQEHQGRISKACYADLFLMMTEIDRREITATEIAERKEEKLLALGPVLEQLNQDVLDPDIDLTFEFMLRQGLIPPPPEELQGMELKVEYQSIMAQAQKLIGVSVMERFAGTVAQIGQVNPDALDKVDFDQYIDELGDSMSVPASVIRPDDQVAKMRQAKAQAVQAQAQAQQMAAAGKTVKDLATAPMDGDSALGRLMQTAQAGQLTQ